MGEYQHQEPIFRSSEGKDVTPYSKKAATPTPEKEDTVPPDATEREVTLDIKIPERNETDLQNLLNQIKEDRQLSGILAFLTRGDFNDRDNIDVNDVKDFYTMFPTEEDYMKKSDIGILLTEIKERNDSKKYSEYNHKAITFVDLMFPEK